MRAASTCSFNQADTILAAGGKEQIIRDTYCTSKPEVDDHFDGSEISGGVCKAANSIAKACT